MELSGDPTDAPRPFFNPLSVTQLANTPIGGSWKPGSCGWS